MTVNYYQNRDLYLEGMQQWLHDFELLMQNDPEAARKQALQSLIQSGIFKKDGTPKKRIVTSSVLA